VIKFVINTKTFGLKVQPKLDNNLGWDLKIFCDSNWVGDPEKRVNVTGFIIYLLNVPILLVFQVTKRSDFTEHRGQICRNFQGC
jgi:hypothetical protein